MNRYKDSWWVILLALAVGLLSIGAGVAVVLGILWGIWQLWMFVIPELFIQAPEGFKYPGYWLFVSCIVLFKCLKFTVFGYPTTTVKENNESKD